MVKYHKFLIRFVSVFLVSNLFASCAIHAGFPFICFKKDCIKAQFSGTRKESGGRRSLKRNITILITQTKRKLKKAQTNSDNKLSATEIQEVNAMLGDTTLAQEFIKVIFFHKIDSIPIILKSDSVNVKSAFLAFPKEDRLLIRYCLEKYQIKKIKKIIITAVTNEQNPDNNTRLSYMKAKRISHFLVRNRIKQSKIVIVQSKLK